MISGLFGFGASSTLHLFDLRSVFVEPARVFFWTCYLMEVSMCVLDGANARIFITLYFKEWIPTVQFYGSYATEDSVQAF